MIKDQRPERGPSLLLSSSGQVSEVVDSLSGPNHHIIDLVAHQTPLCLRPLLDGQWTCELLTASCR